MILRLASVSLAATLVVFVISMGVLKGGGDKPPARRATLMGLATRTASATPISSDAGPTPTPPLARPTTVGVATVATPQPVREAACSSATYSVVGESPLGRSYVAGDTLELMLAYETDGCTEVGGAFSGYHSPGSQFYDYYCPTDCGPRLASSFAYVEPAHLAGRTGIATFAARVGTFPPLNLGSPADIDGFTLCSVSVTFTDGKFGGSYVEVPLGSPCGGSHPTRPR